MYKETHWSSARKHLAIVVAKNTTIKKNYLLTQANLQQGQAQGGATICHDQYCPSWDRLQPLNNPQMNNNEGLKKLNGWMFERIELASNIKGHYDIQS